MIKNNIKTVLIIVLTAIIINLCFILNNVQIRNKNQYDIIKKQQRLLENANSKNTPIIKRKEINKI